RGRRELRVGGVDRAAAEQLLAGVGLVAAVRDQLIAEAGGNPLALIELSRGLSGPQRAGSVTPLALPAASPAGRGQEAFAARVGGGPRGGPRGGAGGGGGRGGGAGAGGPGGGPRRQAGR